MFALGYRYVISHRNDDTPAGFLIIAAIVFLIGLYVRRSRYGSTAYGSACWCGDKVLRAWRMLGAQGLILGRTAAGALIRLPRYCHLLLVGGMGSGKGVSIIIPNLLDYLRGALVVFDTKGDLFATTAQWRKRRGQRVVRLAPFNGGEDRFNPLDTIPANSPLLIDSARAVAESLVVRLGTEHDPHWNDKVVQITTAVLVLVLLKMDGPERSLNSVQEIASDPQLLFATAVKLHEIGGLPARLGSQIKGLFEKPGLLTKEGFSVTSVMARHLSFLDSDIVAHSVENSTFDVQDLLQPGVTLYLQVPPDQLEAQKGLLRCWILTSIRVLGASGNEKDCEVLFILDEASALGSLAALEEGLVRGRSGGARFLLAYQSDAQVTAAFKDKPTLLYDNCSTQIYLCPPGSYETAERISKSLGDWTQWVSSYGENSGWSSSSGPQGGSSQTSGGSSLNLAPQGLALLRPEEVLTFNENWLIVFVRGLPAPVLAERVKWYEDAQFNSAGGKKRRRYFPRGILWKLCRTALWSVLATSCVLLFAYLWDRSHR